MSRCEPRASSVLALLSVLDGTSLDKALAKFVDHPARSLVFEFCYGVFRHWFSLNELLEASLNDRKKLRDPVVRCLLLVGMYQIAHTRIPNHAAVSESVSAAKRLGRKWSAGFVNAVLRNCDPNGLPMSLEAQYEMPKWLIEQLVIQYPRDWKPILKVLGTRAPLILRVNSRRGSAFDYLECFNPLPALQRGSNSFTLAFSKPRPRVAIPGYREGWATIQDEASQCAIPLLEIKSGERVLDACAAPGIKTLQIVEQHPNVELVSIDPDSSSSNWFETECARLSVQADIRIGNATNLQWWDGKPFDKILVDAPCSGTGTIRRHPDIKIHRSLEGVQASARLQLAILHSVWPTLRTFGCLLYTTCSLLQQENEEVVQHFMHEHHDAELIPISLSLGKPAKIGHLVLPIEGGCDGFYFCLIRKSRVLK